MESNIGDCYLVHTALILKAPGLSKASDSLEFRSLWELFDEFSKYALANIS